jgi:hypothetical protein
VRPADEVAAFSAVPGDYLRVPQENVLRGSRDSGVAADERSLFPGFLAILLAIGALVPPFSRASMTYLGLAIVAADLSLGVNGILFPGLQSVFSMAASLRAPARFGVLVLLSVATLASIGAARLYQRRPRLAPVVSVVLTLLCLAEYWSSPIGVRRYDPRPGEVDAWLAANPPGTVILELPAPTGKTLWLREPEYQLRSIHHWQPMVNGYSAFAPESYVRLINELEDFPERHVITALREIGVKYILIHREHFTEESFDRLMQRVEASSRVRPVRTFGDGNKRVVVLELNYDPE